MQDWKTPENCPCCKRNLAPLSGAFSGSLQGVCVDLLNVSPSKTGLFSVPVSDIVEPDPCQSQIAQDMRDFFGAVEKIKRLGITRNNDG